jgi:type II secretory pathway pseudopilin PulG
VLIIVIVIGSLLLLIILITLVYIIRKIIRQRHNVIPAESVLMERQRERK